MTTLPTGLRHLVRGPAVARLLERRGIDPRQYWVLVDLFETLGARQELMGLGSYDSVRFLAILWFILSAFISVVMAVTDAAPQTYLLIFLALTVFQLSVVLVAEIAESLVNPVDGLVLAHQPVNGATWWAAKVTHLVRVVVYVVMGMNGVPAFVGVLLSHSGAYARLTYPLIHFMTVLATGLVVGLLCCSLFGWLVRFVPVRRLKGAAAAVQAVPMLLIFGFRYLDDLAAELQAWAASVGLPAAWRAAGEALPGGFGPLVVTATVAVATFAVVFGLRALSRDHLIRASSLMQSGAGTRRRRRRRLPTARWVGKLAGGQAARAGYEYLRWLLVRDWQFRRSMAMQAPGLLVMLTVLLVVGRDRSPFGPDFAFAHFLPHLLGMLVLIVCLHLAYGNDYKGAWSLAVVPDDRFRPFARGIHAALWILVVLLPNAFSLVVLAWSWGVVDAALFIAYCTAVASLYLGVGLRLIGGVPFGKPMDPTRNALAMGAMLVFFMAAAVAVGIQYVLFRWIAAVVGMTIAVAVGAGFLTSITLDDFATRMRESLKPATPGSMFRLT
ncbi:MAG: hypothetical protein F4W89_15580 [Acidobacteria bacterium]|nr:hypothetical protein [Acidobacteriota bacterium]